MPPELSHWAQSPQPPAALPCSEHHDTSSATEDWVKTPLLEIAGVSSDLAPHGDRQRLSLSQQAVLSHDHPNSPSLYPLHSEFVSLEYRWRHQSLTALPDLSPQETLWIFAVIVVTAHTCSSSKLCCWAVRRWLRAFIRLQHPDASPIRDTHFIWMGWASLWPCCLSTAGDQEMSALLFVRLIIAFNKKTLNKGSEPVQQLLWFPSAARSESYCLDCGTFISLCCTSVSVIPTPILLFPTTPHHFSRLSIVSSCPVLRCL